ncbi:MAG: ABC transporter ATP-binding protein, partial [Acidimicrobiales bacterium]
AALLGDPAVIVLDEPVHGLDTEGIRWLRILLQDLAADGRTVFLSSHLMSEMELTADEIVVIGRGELIAAEPMSSFIDAHSKRVTIVRSPDAGRLRAALAHLDASIELDPTGAWRVIGPDTAAIGDLALRETIAIHELRPLRSSLEDVYSELTAASVEYGAAEQVA